MADLDRESHNLDIKILNIKQLLKQQQFRQKEGAN